MKRLLDMFKKVSLILIILLSLSGCMQIKSNYFVYDTGEYEFNLTVLLPKKVYESSALNFDTYKTLFIEEMNLQNDAIVQIEEVINDIEYVGFKVERPKTFPSDEHNIQITVDKKKNQILFVLDNHLSDDIFISLDAFDLGHDSLEALKEEGLEIFINIQMPGKILSASGGVINDNVLTYDLINNDMHKLIVLSKTSNILPQLIAIAIIIIIIIILAIVFIKNNMSKKHKKQNNKDKIKVKEVVNIIPPKIEDKKEIVEDDEDDIKDNDILQTLLLENENDDENPY